ncbi:MAG: SDR family oxidoreductase [Clostridiales bacterium]|nr:SDR family oxidoreductase [Clostridiales bacterium]
MISLEGKVALITGASRGIGKAIATDLAKAGIRLALNSSTEKSIEETRRELVKLGAEILSCPGDLADSGTPEVLIDRVVGHFGGIDILINNAGVAIPKPIVETSIEEWDLHMAVNARAPFLLSRGAIPYLKKSDAATIINISSVVGYKGYINQGAYTASKHALMGITKVLAQEVHQDDIRVYTIAPGGVFTDMVSKMRPDLDTSELIKPKEISDIIMFILTHRGNAMIDQINVHRFSNTPWI